MISHLPTRAEYKNSIYNSTRRQKQRNKAITLIFEDGSQNHFVCLCFLIHAHFMFLLIIISSSYICQQPKKSFQALDMMSKIIPPPSKVVGGRDDDLHSLAHMGFNLHIANSFFSN